MDLTNLTIAQAHNGLQNKDFSAVELARAYLAQIKKTDGEIGAYLTVTEELALGQAAEADKKIAQGGGFPSLCGVPCSIKDAIMVEGQTCSAGSRILKNYIAPYDATVIKKLKKEGAVILGKTNLDEFAMGVSTENSAFKTTKNPNDLSRVAGGSSGGSAASVASRQACYSLGSDTGGSIRLPASFCGIVGLNPTYGAVSRYGLAALASSLDQIGPMAKTVEDCRIVFEAIEGKDPLDATSADCKLQIADCDLRGCRVGVPKEYFGEGLNAEVKKIIEKAIKKAEENGAKIVEISLPNSKYAIAAYYIIVPSEASSNLARYDGIKYGLSRQEAENLLAVYLKSRGEGFGAEPKRRILLGTHSLSSGYYDAYYKKAQEIRALVKQDFYSAFEKVDFIFSPVSPTTAFKIGEKVGDPLSLYLMDIYTGPVKLAGIPAVSIPAGTAEGLPVGLQIMGNYFEEGKLLAVAEAMEKLLQ